MDKIVIKNAYTHNLKNLNLTIPLHSFTCVTGSSGSGKSSLVFDTIYAESQRRLFDGITGNLYGQKLINKPKVDAIENLYPALNISQNYYNVNPRSTVGTVTEISYYLRALFSLLNGGVSESLFSANNPKAYCQNCRGLGVENIVSEDLLIPDKNTTLKDGAILYFKGSLKGKESAYLQALCDHYNIDINKRFSELSREEIYNLLYVDEKILHKIKYKEGKKSRQHNIFLRGAIADINEKLKIVDTSNPGSIYSRYMEEVPCRVCGGAKLNPSILKYKVNDLNYSEFESMELLSLKKWLKNFCYEKISNELRELVSQVVESILQRLDSLINLNVGYLCLNRTIPSLSGGERQRIRIANQLNCGLKGLIYILDEPCKGLHFRDIISVIKATKNLIGDSNTVIAIEHNQQYISAAENIIELGPVGGPDGGYIIPHKKIKLSDVMTADFHKNGEELSSYFELKNVTFHNIKNQNVRVPIGGITCVTGVSGSGKTSLVKVIATCFERNTNFQCDFFSGGETIGKVVEVNQAPIGKNPRSTIISYLNIYDEIRSLYSQTHDAEKLKLSSSDFSMNVKGGRCEFCQGTGVQKIELNYLPQCYVKCPECDGKRFTSEILWVHYKGKTIQEILDNTIADIIDLFSDKKRIFSALNSMIKLGLGYLKLGQMSMNLSGGEAQRIKLAKALSAYSNKQNLYIFDEPTSGLNNLDIVKFIDTLSELKSNNGTVIIVEHNLEFVMQIADYVIDFGISGGKNGGKIVAQGTPVEVFKNPKSSIYNLEF